MMADPPGPDEDPVRAVPAAPAAATARAAESCRGRVDHGGHHRWPLCLAVVRSTGHGRNPGPAWLPAPVAVSETGHRLLGVTAGWQVFGYGPNQVIRIQLARGRITRTTVPPLQSNGPVFFLACPGPGHHPAAGLRARLSDR